MVRRVPHVLPPHQQKISLKSPIFLPAASHPHHRPYRVARQCAHLNSRARQMSNSRVPRNRHKLSQQVAKVPIFSTPAPEPEIAGASCRRRQKHPTGNPRFSRALSRNYLHLVWVRPATHKLFGVGPRIGHFGFARSTSSRVSPKGHRCGPQVRAPRIGSVDPIPNRVRSRRSVRDAFSPTAELCPLPTSLAFRRTNIAPVCIELAPAMTNSTTRGTL